MEVCFRNARGAAEARGDHRQLDARAAGPSPRVQVVRAASSRVHVRAASQAAATANRMAGQKAGAPKRVATRKANATGGEGAWTDGEENKFRTAVGRFGRDWVRVAAAVGTRDSDQCADFAVGKDYVPPARRPRHDRARTRR